MQKKAFSKLLKTQPKQASLFFLNASAFHSSPALKKEVTNKLLNSIDDCERCNQVSNGG